MSNTVHKVLVHGSHIISGVTLPIGMYSEEAQEALNKVYRSNRLHHTRKCSRLANNENLMKVMLARSDPYLYSLTKHPESPSSDIPEDVRNLLKSS